MVSSLYLLQAFMQLVEDHPEYVAIVGMGIVVLLLFIVTIVIICTMGSRRR